MFFEKVSLIYMINFKVVIVMIMVIKVIKCKLSIFLDFLMLFKYGSEIIVFLNWYIVGVCYICECNLYVKFNISVIFVCVVFMIV